MESSQVARCNVIEGNGGVCSLPWKDGSGAASLHGLFLVHFFELLWSHALVVVLANTYASILKVFEEDFASMRLKTALEQKTLDTLIDSATYISQVSRHK